MSSDIVISVENVSKAYRIWNDPGARLKSPLIRACGSVFPHSSGLRHKCEAQATSYYRDFYALKDISFQVRKGESVGIIGRNGSGKSTLLQIIAGTLQPTTGSVRVNGRVAALLELGSGFNPDFTGRENVYLNAAVLGLSRAETDAKFDSIAAFADIGDFIDQPVKTYSSGMMMRLAFSIQTAVDPDILIIDESLAVGDAQFVAKCINWVSEFLRSGRNLLFVSHEVGLVRQLTTKALYLDHGHQVVFGSTPETILSYTSALTLTETRHQTEPDRFIAPDAPYSIETVRLVRPPGGQDAEPIPVGTPMRMETRLRVRASQPAELVFSVYNYMGIIVYSLETELARCPESGGSLIVTFDIPRTRLAPGAYRVNFAVRHGVEIFAWARNALHFSIHGDTSETYIYREDIATTVVLEA